MENNKSQFKRTGVLHGDQNAEHCLWAHDEQKQIDKMRELYDLLPVKPEWLTREQIDEYAARMNVKIWR